MKLSRREMVIPSEKIARSLTRRNHMSAITPTLLRQSYDLTAAFYAAGIDCPPLIMFNEWMSRELAKEAARPIKPATVTTTKVPAPQATFATALTSALISSPDGVSIADLRAILAPYKPTATMIGATLGRMTKAGTAEKKGELWFAKSATITGIDKRRKTAGKTPAAASNGEAAKQAAA
jgi:hypothetical protein